MGLGESSLANLPIEDQYAVVYGVADALRDVLSELSRTRLVADREEDELRQVVEQHIASLAQGELPPGLWAEDSGVRAPHTRLEIAPGKDEDEDAVYSAAWDALQPLLSGRMSPSEAGASWVGLLDKLDVAIRAATDACLAPSFSEAFEKLLPEVPPAPEKRRLPDDAAGVHRYRASMVGLLIGIREGISECISVEFADGWDVALLNRHKKMYGRDLDEALIEMASEGLPGENLYASSVDFEFARQQGKAAGYNAYNDVFSAFLDAGAAPEALDWAPTARAPLVLAASLDRVVEALGHAPR